MKWILILTLYADGGYDGGPAMSSIPGFNTERACMVAATEWLKQVRSIYSVTASRALCVPTGELKP